MLKLIRTNLTLSSCNIQYNFIPDQYTFPSSASFRFAIFLNFIQIFLQVTFKKINSLSLMFVKKIEAFKLSLLTLCVKKTYWNLINTDWTSILPLDKKSIHVNFTKINAFLCT